MSGIVFGLAAASVSAIGMLASTSASRRIGAAQSVAWSATLALPILAVVALSGGLPDGLGGGPLVLLGVGGLVNLGGFLATFSALRIGKVGVVAPIIATNGALAAFGSALLGDGMAPAVAASILVMGAGVVLAARAPAPARVSSERTPAAVGLALIGSACFAVNLLVLGLLADRLPIAWLLLPSRIAAFALVFVPLAVSTALVIQRRTLPLVVLLAVCDVGGIALYTVGARDDVAVAAVVASLMAPMAAVLAFAFLGERLGRGQVAGMALIVAGLVGLGLVRA